jgi:hypothetical protein
MGPRDAEVEKEAERRRRRLSDVGGTSGGLGEFVVGLALMAAGAWLFLGRIVVVSSLGTLFGHSALGLALLPLAIGIAVLFFDGGSKLGWALAVGALAIILVGVIADLRLFFKPTGLPATVGMLVLIFVGMGMIGRSLRPH